MKKIVFVVINMNIGGTEKALLSLINEMDNEKWDITVLMLEKYGELLDDIPSWVKVQYVEGYNAVKELIEEPPLSSLEKLLSEKRYHEGMSVAVHYGISKLSGSLLHWYKYILKSIKVLDETYDIAVAYAGPMDLISILVNEKIRAKKKIQWIHFDVTKIGMDTKIVKKIYSKFDKIFIVSEEGKQKFISKFPSVENIVEVKHNVISKQKILEEANSGESFNDNFEGVRILTVGRLSKEKGQDIVIQVLGKLKEAGYNVKWYCIGDGSFRIKCEKLIKQYKLEDDFILLGTKKNPYHYMKDCNIYVQPSRHEGYCITLAETICFNKPIVATDFTGAREQLNNYDKGLVCNGAEEDIYEGLKIILEDEEFYL